MNFLVESEFSSRTFLLNPNFLLVHRNRYSEGMEDGQKTPRGHPDFHSFVIGGPELEFSSSVTLFPIVGLTAVLKILSFPALELGDNIAD